MLHTDVKRITAGAISECTLVTITKAKATAEGLQSLRPRYGRISLCEGERESVCVCVCVCVNAVCRIYVCVRGRVNATCARVRVVYREAGWVSS